MNDEYYKAAMEALRNLNDHAIPALKAAYARGHYCNLGERCPGCMAGNALEQITGRKWTQEECEQ